MAVDNVITQTATDMQGNTYTTAISNDALTNNDFMKILLEQMKMQDPTKPMDSKEMLNSQLQMSTIQANLDMSKSMQSLQESYKISAISNAANLIGRVIEDGSLADNGTNKQYKVQTIESDEDGLYAKVREYSIVDGEEVLGQSSTISLENIKKIS